MKGTTLGIVGLGRVGAEVAKRARAFEMHVVTWSIPPHPERAQALGVERCATLHTLAEVSDIISVHLPQSVETRRIFSAEVFARMKPRTIFVNTSRGGVVDEAALADAMRDKQLRVGLDGFEREPADAVAVFRPALADAGLFVGTPHTQRGQACGSGNHFARRDRQSRHPAWSRSPL